MNWLADYDYDLPSSSIAVQPVEPRDASRLLVLDRETGSIEHRVFRDLPNLLEPGDCLVVNETRVLRARMLAQLERTGRAVEILLSHPVEHDWMAMLGPGRRLRPGDRLTLREGSGAWVVLGKGEQGLWRLSPEGDPWRMMEEAGHLPLPPYLHRGDRAEDRDWYQTVFARKEGAIAAPTAGLHFTERVLKDLEERRIALTSVVLHVGPGTFLPVRAQSEAEHVVLAERFEVPDGAVQTMAETRARGGRVVAVGTTVVRALESAAQGQAAGWTSLTIAPGYRFTQVDALVTNFHLPRSSLLLLVAAFAGRESMLRAYGAAVEAGYRFYSYGDAMLIRER